MPTETKLPDMETPERKLIETRMYFAKLLGLAIRAFHNSNNGQMPASLVEAIPALGPGRFQALLASLLKSATLACDLREDQFELVFRGQLDSHRENAGRILAWAKEPIQLSNGRWARACVFCDGSAAVLVADTKEDLAAKAGRLMPIESRPASR